MNATTASRHRKSSNVPKMTFSGHSSPRKLKIPKDFDIGVEIVGAIRNPSLDPQT